MTELHSMGCNYNPRTNHCVSKIYHHLSEADAPLAMGFIPYQNWHSTYSLCEGLKKGTIFPCLYKPFCGKGGRCR